MKLLYPNIREELIETLRAFADRSYQTRVWLFHEMPREDWTDNFDENVKFFGDIGLDSANPDNIIGTVLLNKEELDKVQATKEAIYTVLDKVGKDISLPIKDYIESPSWSDVIKKATIAYKTLTGGKKPEGYFEDIQKKE